MFTANFYKKQLNAELETALSIITTSYLRSENFILAVEENVEYLNPPVQDVFRQFLAQTNLINADVELALENIKPKISNDVFREWVDAVIACQEDKTLKTTLTPIISKLSDMRVVSSELNGTVYFGILPCFKRGKHGGFRVLRVDKQGIVKGVLVNGRAEPQICFPRFFRADNRRRDGFINYFQLFFKPHINTPLLFF
jgi:hypothetical protein